MATMPDEDEVPQTTVERVKAVVAAQTSDKQRPITLLAISAGLAALAPSPFDAGAVALLVLIAYDLGKRR